MPIQRRSRPTPSIIGGWEGGTLRWWAASVVAALSLGAIACGGATPGTGDAASAWSVAAQPRLDVGDREDGDSVVFTGVQDARLLPNGLLAVADGGTSTIRFFDAQGTLVHRVGRRGRGPGEFTSGMQFMDFAGDSVAVWDPGQSRWTIVSSRGGATRQVAERTPSPVWVHAGVDIRSALPAPPEWVIARITSLGLGADAPRLAHLDATGMLWVRNERVPGEWRAYVDSGAAVGTVTLPKGERVLHFAPDAIVSLLLDSLGLERVLVRALTKGAHAPPVLDQLAVAPVDSGARSTLMAAMRQAVTAHEMHFAVHGGYTAARDSLQLTMPEGAELRLIEVTNRGWRGVGYFKANGYSCGMIIGLAAPAGWSEGEVRCGW